MNKTANLEREMKQIWKFELATERVKKIEMPSGAKVLSVQIQNGIAQLWALVDPGNTEETRTFNTFGTGWEIDEYLGSFIGTYQLPGLVFHVFEA